MDRRERYSDLTTALQAAMKGWQAGMWTSCVATVVSWDAAANTVDLQPSLSLEVLKNDGTTSIERLPLLVNCPVQFPQAGPFALTFPIAPGDEGTVVFASRSIDSWHQSGGHGVAADKRMHDLSDGIFMPGLRSQTRLLSNISTTDVQLRHQDGDAYVSIAADKTVKAITPGNVVVSAGGYAHVTAGSTVSLTAPNILLDGNVHVTGSLITDGGGIFNSVLVAEGTATFNTAIIDGVTGKNMGGTHIHDHGTISGSGQTGVVI